MANRNSPIPPLNARGGQGVLEADVIEYEYDDIDQLTQAQGPQGEENFYYDKAGNHLFDPRSNQAHYSKTNALLFIPDQVVYQYDKMGRPTTITDTKKETEFTWNTKSQLEQARVNGKVVKYLYDPFGRRIGKIFEDLPREIPQSGADGVSISWGEYYGYDREDIVVVYNEQGKIKQTYLHGPGIDEVLVAKTSDGRKNYYVTDYLGSVEKVLDKNLETVAKYDYDSFGKRTAKVIKANELLGTTYGYTGREYDEETGLYYHRNRFYTSSENRFLTKDPIGFLGGRNVYAYARNNPQNFTDPLGLEACGLGEACTQVGSIGPFDASKAKKLADEALLKAQNSGLPGLHNGQADAFRHCYWSCRMAQEIGVDQAKEVGDNHEICGKNMPSETTMDLQNNSIGRTFGTKGADCDKKCKDAAKNGTLQIAPRPIVSP